jgi:hypothetical protein
MGEKNVPSQAKHPTPRGIVAVAMGTMLILGVGCFRPPTATAPHPVEEGQIHRPDPCPGRLFVGAGTTAHLCGAGELSHEETAALQHQLNIALRAFAVFSQKQGLALPPGTKTPLLVFVGESLQRTEATTTTAQSGQRWNGKRPSLLNRDDVLFAVVSWMAPQMGMRDPVVQEKLLLAFDSHFDDIEADLTTSTL